MNREYGSGSNALIGSYAVFDIPFGFAYISGSSNGRLSVTRIVLTSGSPTYTYFIQHAIGGSNKAMKDFSHVAGSSSYSIFSCAESLGSDSNDIGFFYMTENYGSTPNLLYSGFVDYTVPT